MAFLNRKAREGNRCLHCQGQFLDWPSALQHMQDKQHLRFHDLLLAELDPFVDFTQVVNDLRSLFELPPVEGGCGGYEDYLKAKQALFQVNDMGELRLANGKLLGSRLLKSYYRKRFHFTHAETLSIESEHRPALLGPDP